jgi:hypothetical protein
MAMATLTVEAVNEMAKKCLFREGEPRNPGVEVDGIVNKWRFHPDRIAANAPAIGELLAELPSEFQKDGGGGWSFLNACMDRHGSQWCDLHHTMEALFCLGIAADRAKWLLPRDLWDSLPGGMPYVAVWQTT